MTATSRAATADSPGQKHPIRAREHRPWATTAQDGQFMSEHNELQFLELAGTKPQDDELQNSLKHNVAEGKEHDASATDAEKRRYSTQTGLTHPTGLLVT
jgi:hypothetical protein